MATPGRFVWYELLTTAPAEARAFYADVIGWNTRPFRDDYTMWVGSQGPLGGVLELPEAARAMGAPPHWLGSVAVADVDATIAKARTLGATIYLEPKDISEVGRYAVLADPTGAPLAVFTPLQHMTEHDPTKVGEVCWRELVTTDPAAALAFHAALFGWQKLDEHDMGPTGKYVIYGVGTTHFGGIFAKPPEMPGGSAWSYYVHVADLDAAIARAQAKGARLCMGPQVVPGGARVAQLLDPEGASFALLGAPAATG